MAICNVLFHRTIETVLVLWTLQAVIQKGAVQWVEPLKNYPTYLSRHFYFPSLLQIAYSLIKLLYQEEFPLRRFSLLWENQSYSTNYTLKCWKKASWCLINICVLNSWVIYRSNFPDSRTTINTHKLFRLKLIEELVQPLFTLHASPECPPHLHTEGRACCHWQSPPWEALSYKHSKCQRCAVCSQKESLATGKRTNKKTSNYCPKCNVFLSLGECFEAYHTQMSYK